MMKDGFVLRHDPQEARDGEVQPIEGAFLACTLWLADVYILLGRVDDARELYLRVHGIANDVGLLSEEYDPTLRRQTGNFPQALTHIAMINSAQNIFAALHPDKPAVQRAKKN
jgi:GH15 family glucan-1,4-alpha-glucosidase